MNDFIRREDAHRMVVQLDKYAWVSPVSDERRVTVDVDLVKFGLDRIPTADVAEVVLPPEERTLDFPVKYTEICALYHFCVDLGIKCTIERLHDGYAVRFPDGSDFAQHHGTYGGTEGCVEPAIGDSEFDYTAVGLNLAKELVKKHKGKLEADHA